ncbi:MAG: intradiol ring-cleavage dioxygenase [Gemmatimonadaceae bacterium]
MLPTNLIVDLLRRTHAGVVAPVGWLAGAVVLALACGADAQRTATSAARGQTGQIRALPECEWCGAAEAPSKLGPEMRLAGAGEPGIPLVVSGTVYRPDGSTPARGVLLYAYHTNAAGVYPKRGNETGNGRRHGYLRGWLRTDSHGRYSIATIRPAPYTTRNSPAHIHVTVTPPGCAEDYIDSIMFDDDPLLTPVQRARLAGRGGSGVVHAVPDGRGGLQVTRDIVLESGQCLL